MSLVTFTGFISSAPPDDYVVLSFLEHSIRKSNVNLTVELSMAVVIKGWTCDGAEKHDLGNKLLDFRLTMRQCFFRR